MRIYVDIDGILTKETKGVPFWQRTPNVSSIEKINHLYEGHKITLYTRRRVSDKRVTVKWLANNNVYYHKLIIGKKPNYDALIDDKAFNSVEDFERSILK